MAKSKKNVDAFQKAMLAHTKVIGNQSEPSGNNKHESVTGLEIPPEILEKFQAFVEKHDLSYQDTLYVALDHFLKMEDYWFSND